MNYADIYKIDLRMPKAETKKPQEEIHEGCTRKVKDVESLLYKSPIVKEVLKCGNCHKKVGSEDLFCKSCGFKFLEG